MLQNPNWNKPSRSDFIQWLESKDPNEGYNYSNTCGDCLIGQYMTHKGHEWDINIYSEFCARILGREEGIYPNIFVLSLSPQTFGGALNRVRELADI